MADEHSQDLGNRSPAAPDKHTAWVIWLHGLGDSGSGWLHLLKTVGDDLPWVKWSFPDAAERPMSCSGGRYQRSWFDISELPVPLSQEIGIDGELRTTSDALRDPDGLPSAVSAVHAMLKQAESMGFPPSRICLGGFSQGAALALLAARLYPKPLGGVIGLSGWHLRPGHRPRDSPNHATPIMLLHGTRDDTVPVASQQESIELLLSGGHSNVTHHEFSGEGHGDCPEAHRQIRAFLQRHLPRVHDSGEDHEAGGTRKAAIFNAPAQSKSVIKMGGRRAAARSGAPSNPALSSPTTSEAADAPTITPPLQAAGGMGAPAAFGPQLLAATGEAPIGPQRRALGPEPQSPLPPEYSMTDVDGALRLVVALPPTVEGMAGLDLQLSDEGGMELSATDGSIGVLRVNWPSAAVGVNTELARAKFSKKTRELRVVVPHT